VEKDDKGLLEYWEGIEKIWKSYSVQRWYLWISKGMMMFLTMSWRCSFMGFTRLPLRGRVMDRSRWRSSFQLMQNEFISDARCTIRNSVKTDETNRPTLVGNGQKPTKTWSFMCGRYFCGRKDIPTKVGRKLPTNFGRSIKVGRFFPTKVGRYFNYVIKRFTI